MDVFDLALISRITIWSLERDHAMLSKDENTAEKLSVSMTASSVRALDGRIRNCDSWKGLLFPMGACVSELDETSPVFDLWVQPRSSTEYLLVHALPSLSTTIQWF